MDAEVKSLDLPLILAAAALMLVAWLAQPRASAAGAQIDGARGTVTIVRRLVATDQEAQEGYFGLGSQRREGVMIVVDSEGDLATFLRAKVGRMVEVRIRVVEE